MSHVLQPFHLLVITLAGWLNRHQQSIIDYLIEENRVLKEPRVESFVSQSGLIPGSRAIWLAITPDCLARPAAFRLNPVEQIIISA